MLRKAEKLFLGATLVILLTVNLLHIFKGDILFHADIARDFLVMGEMVEEHKLTLIGPKSGGVTGVFHGPAWYYLNLPAFMATGGDPSLMGVWWLALYAGFLGVAFCLSKKMLGTQVGLWTTVILGYMTAFYSQNFLQSFGAMLLMLPLYYFIVKYVKEKKARDLSIGVFLLGMMIQFQMAVGGPLLLTLGLLLTIVMAKNKLWKHFLCWLIIIIPLSTFILFDLRHDFLQTNGVVNYLTQKKTGQNMAHNFWRLRANALIGQWSLVSYSGEALRIGSAVLMMALVIMLIRRVCFGTKSPERSQNKDLKSQVMMGG